MFAVGVVVGLLLMAGIAVPAAILLIRRATRRVREAERRARSAERLAEIGAMTGGLAHEIKNPLSTIGLNAQLLAEGIAELPIDSSEKGRLVRRVEALRREADRLRDILQDFLRFTGGTRLDAHPRDLVPIIEELIDFYQPQAQRACIALRTDLAASLPRVMLDAAQFKQALLNLLINATQAIEDRPRVEDPAGVPTPTQLNEIIVRARLVKRQGEPRVEVRIADTGPGIAADHLERIFTPYFTTKSGGSGLGLPTTRRIIEEHGGRIDVTTEPGRGTEFVISLPLAVE